MSEEQDDHHRAVPDRDEPMPENPKRTNAGERILCSVEERALAVALQLLKSGETQRGVDLLEQLTYGPRKATRGMDGELEHAARALNEVWNAWMRRLMENGAIAEYARPEIQKILATSWEHHPEAARQRARYYARQVLRLPDTEPIPARMLL